MPTISHKFEKIVLWGAVGLAFCALAVLILLLDPWYGTMDDGSLLKFCDASRSHGFQNAVSDYVRADREWGMYRPLYPFMIQALYCSVPGPSFLYLANLCFIFLFTVALGFALYPLLPKAQWPRGIFLPAFCGLTFLVYRFHDLFIFPSLQEKLVLSAGAFGLLIFGKRFRRTCSSSVAGHLLDILCLFFVLLVGFSTKAQFLLFLPAFALILWACPVPNEQKGWWWTKQIVFFSVAIAGMVMIKKLAAGGSYTSSYSFAKVPENLASRTALIVLAMGCFSFAYELWRLRRELISRTWRDYAYALVPASFPLAFLAIMLPWKIGDSYLLSVVAPFQAFLVLSWAQSWPRTLWLKVLPFLLVAMLTLTAYRGYRGFGRWSDLGAILFSEDLAERHRMEPEAPLVVPCLEGAVLVKIYLERFRQLELSVVDAFPNDGRSYLALFDTALCRPEDPAVYALSPLSQPHFSGSFRLYQSSGGRGAAK